MILGENDDEVNLDEAGNAFPPGEIGIEHGEDDGEGDSHLEGKVHPSQKREHAHERKPRTDALRHVDFKGRVIPP